MTKPPLPVVGMGAGAAEFDGLRQDVFQRGQVKFVFAIPAADFFSGFFGNQAVAADDFSGGVVECEEVVAMFVVRIDIATASLSISAPSSWANT